jgi:N utilization substance protein B
MILNRRHLRTKVLQALYAFQQTEDADVQRGFKELTLSINKVYDLYLTYLTLLAELSALAHHRLEEGKNKKLPSAEDLNPNSRFAENAILHLLSVNTMLRKESETRKINWIGEQEIVRNIYAEIRKSEAYDTYMNKPECSFDDQKAFAEHIFREFVANSEDLQGWLEEKSIYWTDDIDLVCNMVVKTLQTFDADSNEATPIFGLYKDPEDDQEFVKRLYMRTIDTASETEKIIDSKTDNWELDRIALMDRILMRMAITEAREFPSIPVKVSLNEYIEISKYYSTPKSNSFINGILDRAFTELRQKGAIKKTGRGLIE